MCQLWVPYNRCQLFDFINRAIFFWILLVSFTLCTNEPSLLPLRVSGIPPLLPVSSVLR